MGQAISSCCTCEQPSKAPVHCFTCADDAKINRTKVDRTAGEVVFKEKIHKNSEGKHKKCLIKGEILKDSNKSFAENLRKSLNISEQNIYDFYKIGKVVGIGEYGTVREGWSLAEDSLKVAIKILDLKEIQKTFKSICCEVSSLKQANHKNIIKLHQVFMDDKKVYLVLEYVDGVDLSDFIVDGYKLREKEVKYILQQMTSTIEYLHSIHICHRDIKLDNIMVNTDTFDIKLIDFGFSTNFSELDHLNCKCGTPYYVAPEVLKGSYGKECDMWSIGIMTYYMLTGEPPFHSDSDSKLFDSIIKDEVMYPTKVWYNISSEARDFIEKLLIKDCKKRMTAEESLEHEWLYEGDKSSSTRSDTKCESS
ncbi:unnamed protein product [Moneuplotes crassus]|uniref:Protein kinase domain-containing protein n=2 Tax=Euplotes crassus TaxID=5936 RepID=A0AAD1XJG0_EUPCR|nr:unnamed protein product [Moneuplotes crassus]